MPAVDHAALLTELLPLVDERYQAALLAGIADIGRLDKIERLKLEFSRQGERFWCQGEGCGHAGPLGIGIRAAIDGVPE